MMNRAIIEVSILDEEKIKKIEKIGIEKVYIQTMREIYNTIEYTYRCKHIRIEKIFDIGRDFFKTYWKDEDFDEGFYEVIVLKYYLEFEDDVDFNGGNDLYDLLDLYCTWIEGDCLAIGFVGHITSDFDGMIVDGVDWTKKEA